MYYVDLTAPGESVFKVSFQLKKDSWRVTEIQDRGSKEVITLKDLQERMNVSADSLDQFLMEEVEHFIEGLFDLD